MNLPVIYSSKAKKLGVLTDAENIVTKKRINGASGLELDVKRTSPQWKFVENENIINIDGDYYTVKVVADGRDDAGKPYGTISATCSWWEAAEKGRHIPKIFCIGKPPREIIDTAFAGVLSVFGAQLRQLTDEEIRAIGYEPVTTPTDIEMDKTNPMSVLSKIINNVGGELYIKGFEFALVQKLGRETGLKFTVDANMKGIDRTCDSTDLITRLYPYGASSMEIDTVNGGVDYIDSQYINKYGSPHIGHKDYKDIEEPNELLRWAQREFAVDNYERIDIPKLTYRCSVIDLWKLKEYGDTERFEVGDSILLHDVTLDIDVRSRVVEHKYYPYEPTKSYVALGNPPKTVLQLISNLKALESNGGSILTTADMGYIANEMTEEIEDIVNDLLNGQLPSGGGAGSNAFDFYLYNNNVIETNFDALDFTKDFPGDGIRRFMRVSNEKIQYIEATLSNDETECDYLLSSRGEPVFWTEIEDSSFYWKEDPEDKDENPFLISWTHIDHKPYTRATVLEPLQFRSIEYGKRAIPDTDPVEYEEMSGSQIIQAAEVLRTKYAVKLRIHTSEKILA